MCIFYQATDFYQSFRAETALHIKFGVVTCITKRYKAVIERKILQATVTSDFYLCFIGY
jgi:hypothetical protein